MAFLYLELKESPERQQEYRDVLHEHSMGLRKSAEFLARAIQLMTAVPTVPNEHHHGVVFLLSRHVAEEIDATSACV